MAGIPKKRRQAGGNQGHFEASVRGAGRRVPAWTGAGVLRLLRGQGQGLRQKRARLVQPSPILGREPRQPSSPA